MTNHIVIGRNLEGQTVYYTGRAGSLFVSTLAAEAFQYSGLEAARRRAMNLNQMTDLHGIRFFAPSPEFECKNWLDDELSEFLEKP